MLLPVRSVGVMGDQRTYENVVALRAVTTEDFMTADWYRFPPEVLDRVSRRIVNEVRGINRVVYDVTSQAPRHDRVGVSIVDAWTVDRGPLNARGVSPAGDPRFRTTDH